MSWDRGVCWHLSLVTAATVEPITLDEAKLQVRRTHVTDDDQYLEDLCIPAVRSEAERATGRQLMTATWDLVLDRFPICTTYIELPRPPLQLVSSVTYVDENGDDQTLSEYDYTVDAPVGPTCQRGRILLNYAEVWPITRCQPNAVTVRFVAGYGSTPTDVPPELRRIMLADLGTMYEHRENLIVGQGYTVSSMPFYQTRYEKFRSHPRA